MPGTRLVFDRITGQIPLLPPAIVCETGPQWDALPPLARFLERQSSQVRWYELIWESFHPTVPVHLRCTRVGVQAAWHGIFYDLSFQLNKITFFGGDSSDPEAHEGSASEEEVEVILISDDEQ